jgi:hypothetical protein
MTQDPRFAAAVAAFREVHREDPEGDALEYHAAVDAWVQRLHPDPPVALRLAAWCQHLRRWAIPRDRFPAGRGGYRRWRSVLARQHADEAATVLAEARWDDATIARVRQLLLKEGLGRDPEVGALQDAVCIVFLAQQLEAFAVRHPRDKVVSILRKTWAKMSEPGRLAAQEVAAGLGASAQALIAEATRQSTSA